MQQQRIPLQAGELAPGTRIVTERTVLAPELCAPEEELRFRRPALLGHRRAKGQGERKHKCTDSSPPAFALAHGSWLLASEPRRDLGVQGSAVPSPRRH